MVEKVRHLTHLNACSTYYSLDDRNSRICHWFYPSVHRIGYSVRVFGRSLEEASGSKLKGLLPSKEDYRTQSFNYDTYVQEQTSSLNVVQIVL